MEIIGQILGILGSAAAIISFQMKENKKFFIFQGLMCTFFVLSYLFLGELSGCFMEFFCIVRALVFSLGKRSRKWWVLALIQGAFTVVSILTFSGWISVVLWVVHIVGTFAMWSDNGRAIRITQLFCVSPGWLIFNIYVFSIGGIICEVMNISSTIVSFIRFGVDGFTPTDKASK